MTRLAIRADVLTRLSGFMSKEETRYYLQGVGVHWDKRQGFMFAATDGHKLGVVVPGPEGVKCQGEEPKPLIVARAIIEAAKDALKAAKKDPRIKNAPWTLWLVLEPGKDDKGHAHYAMAANADAALAETNESVRVWQDLTGKPLVDGTFPDWTRVVPSKINEAALTSDNLPSFDPQHYAAFANATEGKPFAVIPSDGPGAPSLVLAAHCPDFIGVLMPMRSNGRAGVTLTTGDMLDRVNALIGVPECSEPEADANAVQKAA